MSAATITAPAEVVTHAHVRDVDLPGGGGTLALITLDNGRDHTRPTTFGPAGLASLAVALDAVQARRDIVAVGVTGKPFIFLAGADLSTMPGVSERAAALEIGRRGHALFRRLAELGKPSFAFINGAALGGGLELALHCTYRTVSAGVPALALPECFLGLVPGWGGTQLLPNLIGPAAAVTVIIDNPLNQNKTLRGPQAHALGLADAMFEPADFLAESLRWAGAVVRGEITPARSAIPREAPAWDAAVARGRALADAKTHGFAPAPYRALELISLARTASLDDGFAAEDEVLADLIMSDEMRASLYAFDLVQKRAKRPAGAPDPALARPVSMVGVLGAGRMASQLALLFAQRLQVPVILTDLDQARVDQGVARVHGEIAALAAKRRLSQDAANRLTALVTGSVSKQAFAGADFVIEAVFEEMKVKKQVLVEVEAVVSAQCVLATNTSSLSVTEMAADLIHPERVVGFHFFNPVAVLPLLEIGRGRATDDPTLATAFATAKALGKSAVLVKDAPAFVFNRLIIRALGEVVAAVDEGTPFEVADRGVEELGLPMSPLTLLGLVGPAIALHTTETLAQAFPERFSVSPGLRALVAAGKNAVYGENVSDGAGRLARPGVDPEVQALWPQGDHPLTAEQVLDRARVALAQEIRALLDDGVVASAADIDLCLLLGGGWAFWNGGITPYLDRTGVSERVTGSRFLPPGVASAL